jgi:hypothetical protein
MICRWLAGNLPLYPRLHLHHQGANVLPLMMKMRMKMRMKRKRKTPPAPKA